MTDKELLELAAKAIGLKLKYNYLGTRDANQPWNSLDDDGDALRLADQLKFSIVLDFDRIDVRTLDGEISVTEYIYKTPATDTLAATRRAIVRAAAEVAKQEVKG